MATSTVHVDAWQLREIFNRLKVPDKVKSGELKERVTSSRHPSTTLANEPYCTKSQMVGYFNAANDLIAECHRYLRKDGTIGASGKVDPKFVFYANTHYHISVS